MGQFRDFFFIEGQKGVESRHGLRKIDDQRSFLNQTDIREKRVIGERPGKRTAEKPFRDCSEDLEFLFRVEVMKAIHHGCSPGSVSIAVRGDETGDAVFVESRHSGDGVICFCIGYIRIFIYVEQRAKSRE